MPGLDTKSAVQELKDIYSDISDWLKFAEAKHAAFIAAGIAIVAVILDKFKEVNSQSVSAILVLILCMFPSLFSQIPFLNQNKTLINIVVKHYCKSNIAKNNVFYLSIFIRSQIDCDAFRTEYLNEIGVTEFDDALVNSYLDQIIDVSKVASIKYWLFDFAVKILCVVLVFVLLFCVIA